MRSSAASKTASLKLFPPLSGRLTSGGPSLEPFSSASGSTARPSPPPRSALREVFPPSLGRGRPENFSLPFPPEPSERSSHGFFFAMPLSPLSEKTDRLDGMLPPRLGSVNPPSMGRLRCTGKGKRGVTRGWPLWGAGARRHAGARGTGARGTGARGTGARGAEHRGAEHRGAGHRGAGRGAQGRGAQGRAKRRPRPRPSKKSARTGRQPPNPPPPPEGRQLLAAPFRDPWELGIFFWPLEGRASLWHPEGPLCPP
ncbi:MAG: hypothetical protein BWY88_00599 [Synergistetes bacterium ADurb.Bin520]|nr:MAG: hypothetical protein BWY88_00599 [Synergistetes bacterium ADurb.Bin520]